MATQTTADTAYADLATGDVLIDRSGNRWLVTEAATEGDQTTFWLADPATGIKAHQLTKPAAETCAVERPLTHEEQFVQLDAQFPTETGDETPLTVEQVREALGGEVIATETAEEHDARTMAALTGSPFAVPEFAEMTMLEQQSHLFLVHGIFAADVKATKALVSLHEEAHLAHEAGTVASRYVAHGHGGE